jgi:hypothetical protein
MEYPSKSLASKRSTGFNRSSSRDLEVLRFNQQAFNLHRFKAFQDQDSSFPINANLELLVKFFFFKSACWSNLFWSKVCWSNHYQIHLSILSLSVKSTRFKICRITKESFPLALTAFTCPISYQSPKRDDKIISNIARSCAPADVINNKIHIWGREILNFLFSISPHKTYLQAWTRIFQW